MRLSTAVALAVLAGVVLAAVAEWVLFVAFHPQRGGTSVDVTKLALTVVGGVGGVVALVIAYRRQRDVEQGRFVERFGAAAAQLGATDVAVRIAGVYAMAGVADESDGLRRQQCIDVLCGYLRLPYDPEHGSSGRTKRIVTTPSARTAENLDPGKVEEHQEYRQNDREVRATIVRVIASRLRPAAEYDWSARDFDFRTAYLEDADFSGTTFLGAARFDHATFSGDARFDGATFSGAEFANATFSRAAGFATATFSGDAGFDHASFSGDAEFVGATFLRAARFSHASFSGGAEFVRASFSLGAEFVDASFSGTAEFVGATFYRAARFATATFSGDAEFARASFSGDAEFVDATFSGTAEFGHASFSGDAEFVGASFSGTAEFVGTTFSGAARFSTATFSGTAEFASASFSGTAEFASVAFSGATWFSGVAFGTETVSFAGPARWGPPAPVFDWDENISHKPANVEPHEWPPTVAAPPAP
ncbi:uncharacterized protein YjbI with pentapeptide repeats [Nocardia tenerifensis]|uniref:Uncharacterized protein YjbI with pentapeptide repeats n=4 Tax=Nocardia tenerifensis TaxID=228006 RepID=A0A318JSS8_9NOCA|nr:uncharacterized protein YjbI with pentapeptide repeats [Nocardia tenerifensis]